jgi:hypothetical protein
MLLLLLLPLTLLQHHCSELQRQLSAVRYHSQIHPCGNLLLLACLHAAAAARNDDDLRVTTLLLLVWGSKRCCWW